VNFVGGAQILSRRSNIPRDFNPNFSLSEDLSSAILQYIFQRIDWLFLNNCSFLSFQGGTASGSCGTVSWQIEHLDTRLIVMWSVPFNFNIHDSYFAVGMIFNRGKFTSSGYWFNQAQ
jgi:hypothetical protein